MSALRLAVLYISRASGSRLCPYVRSKIAYRFAMLSEGVLTVESCLRRLSMRMARVALSTACDGAVEKIAISMAAMMRAICLGMILMYIETQNYVF